MNNKNDRLWGKFHEVYILLIGFGLTTLGGGLIAYFVQIRSWAYQNTQVQLQYDVKHAEDILSDISCTLDNRIYRMRRIMWAYDYDLDKAEFEKYWEEYDIAKQNWNINIDKNSQLLKLYFGKKAFDWYKCMIRPDLSVTDQMLIEIKRKFTWNLYKKLTDQINKNSKESNEFYVYLSNQIMYEKIGKFQ